MQSSNKRRKLANTEKNKRKNKKLRRKEKKMDKSTQRAKKKRHHKRRSVLLEKSTRTNQGGSEKTGLTTIDQGKTGQEMIARERTDQEEMKTAQEEKVKEVEVLDEALSGATELHETPPLQVGKGFLEETTQDLTTETEIPILEEQNERKDLKHYLQEREVQNEASHPKRMTNR
jgi:hypothetical protein